jgi:CubicO group peptidase (beta-lactamase class C family)
VCLAVSRGGRIEFAARGVAQAFDDAGPLAAPVAVTPRTRTDVGSVTKIVATTAALMALVDGGALTLERRLSELLPWTAGAPCGDATIAALLGHRAGLWEWWPLYLFASAAEAPDPGPALQVAAALPLRYPPEHGRHYSDLGFMLLGAAVAVAAGRDDISAAASELVLAPLGLTSTAYAHPAPGDAVMASSNGDAIERRMIATGEPYPVDGDADGFTGWRDHVLVGEVNDGNAFHVFAGTAGHAGLFSTAEDLLRFGDGLLAALHGAGGGGDDHARPLASAATVRRFLTAGADPGQGLGLRRWRLDGGDEAWGHTGFPGVAVGILPAFGASVALVTNRLHVHGTPSATEPMWQLALRAAREYCLS